MPFFKILQDFLNMTSPISHQESKLILHHLLVNLTKTQTFDKKFIIMKLQKDFRINFANQTLKESGKRSKD